MLLDANESQSGMVLGAFHDAVREADEWFANATEETGQNAEEDDDRSGEEAVIDEDDCHSRNIGAS